MALKSKVLDIATLPESQRGLYKKQGDFFILDVESVDGFALEDVTGLKNALSSERTTAEALKKQVEQFKDIDPAAARDALQKIADLKNGKLDDRQKAQLDATIKELTDKHSKELATLTAERDSALSELYESTVMSEAVSAISKHGGSVKVLLPHVKSSLKLVKENGKHVARVVDAAGNVRITGKSGASAPMTADEFIEGLKADKDYMSCFASTVKSGSGTDPKNTQRSSVGGGNADDFMKMSGSQIVELGRQTTTT
mgnify:FL=1